MAQCCGLEQIPHTSVSDALHWTRLEDTSRVYVAAPSLLSSSVEPGNREAVKPSFQVKGYSSLFRLRAP